jgi:hypothetical protein
MTETKTKVDTVEVTKTEAGKHVVEMNTQLASEPVRRALLATTFKGLTEPLMRQATLEGLIRGFTMKNFFEKDVYALPFKQGYSLVTSIGYARKLAMRTERYVGKSAPTYEYSEDGRSIVSCSITVKALVSGHVGEFTAEVDFKEYTTGQNQWSLRPKTMIAKVAEMHALRMAFPEELSNSFAEEEMEKEITSPINKANELVRDSKLTMGSINKNNIKDAEVKENKTSAESEDGTAYAGSGQSTTGEDEIEYN